MENPSEILPDILWSIIAQLPSKFDSHDVIKALDEKYPHVYAALKDRYDGKGEERTSDSVIARTISRLNIINVKVDKSENINGNENLNHFWRKGVKNEEL